jgi:hypothetical protein
LNHSKLKQSAKTTVQTTNPVRPIPKFLAAEDAFVVAAGAELPADVVAPPLVAEAVAAALGAFETLEGPEPLDEDAAPWLS